MHAMFWVLDGSIYKISENFTPSYLPQIGKKFGGGGRALSHLLKIQEIWEREKRKE